MDQHLDTYSNSMELFQPLIGLSESLVFQFVELFQQQVEIPDPVVWLSFIA